jgi:predicted Zn-dependent peptidase
LRKKYYISNVECINLNFSDSGIFAFNFTGDSAHSKDILNDIIESFNGFRNSIDETELNRAKNILKRTILNNLSDQGNRLEETAKSVR